MNVTIRRHSSAKRSSFLHLIIIIIIIDNEHWYEQIPKLVETSHEGKVTVWNQQVQTDRAIPNNKPDIIIRDNEKKEHVC
jgi:hypothetical protein